MQRFSGKVPSLSGRQQQTHLYGTPKIYSSYHKNPQWGPILCRKSSIHSVTFQLFKTQFNLLVCQQVTETFSLSLFF